MSRKDEVVTSVEPADPLVGSIFDRRFRIEERIAVGGFGAIYRATHVKSGHPLALKVLLPYLAQDLGVVARFRREGATLTALRNPHTITAYELGEAADRTLFITMELLYGETLFERYKANGPFEWRRMVKIASEVCESLEEAHGMGIVHRDLKPTNIHLEQRGDDPDYVKVLDFGIAKILGGSGLEARDITNAGQMIGTLDYMSPEQMLGGTITGQSDIWTLGIVMYEMIAGTMPFPESLTAAQALAAITKTRPEPLRRRAPVPDEVDRIVMRCLERDTSRRYQTVGELRQDLVRLLAGHAPNPAATLETVPIEKHDDEVTTFTPPPEHLVRRSKRPSVEATTFTPPPEPLLAQSRRSEDSTMDTTDDRRLDWSSSESTALVSPSQQLLARARRPKRPSAEPTTFTPPPMPLLDELRSAPAWGDDDELAATVRHPRSDPDAHDRETAVARLADIVERAAKTRGPAGAPRPAARSHEVDASALTEPRERASELDVTHPLVRPEPAPAVPVPGLVVAPFSSRPAAEPAPVSSSPGVPSQAPTPAGIAPPSPAALSSYPVMVQSSPASFDMGRMAAREAMIRRLIWGVVVLVAVGVGALLATQL